MALRITDYVHRGNGITVSFSDGDVCEVTHEFDPQTQSFFRAGCPDGQKLFLIQQLLDTEPVDALGAVDARFIDRRPEYRTDAFSLFGTASDIRPIRFSRIVQIAYLDPPLGPPRAPVGTIDPGNVSTSDFNLINGNLTDLCFNNSVIGSAGRELPAIDYGAVIPLRFVEIYWWNQSFIATNFDIEISTNGTVWTSTGPYTGTWLGSGVAQLVAFPALVNARYVRLRCLTGADVNFIVVSEMQSFTAGSPPETKLLDLFDQRLEVKDLGNDTTEFTALLGGKLDIIVQYLVG